ncbi:MFS transporter [Helicobacter sp. MIT 11-5569]|nr:MFS transporter [Helicobacter sp. MIT 11-5569]
MVTISSLYVTQPIQPLLAEIFEISIAQVTLFTSVVLLALAVAPIVYGYLLEKFDTRIILTTALTCIGIFQCLLCFAQDYSTFLTLRILEALIIPAALTATLTTATRLDTQNMQKVISIYVASTIFGGAFSRIGSGLITSLFSWQVTFALLGIMTLGVAFMSYYLPKSTKLNHTKITPRIFVDFLKDKRYALLYMGAFLVLFCFQGALNLMPFEIKAIDPNISTAKIGFLYTGYSIGIVTALLASYITKIAKGSLNAIVLGFIIFGAAPLLMLIPDFWWMFFSVFVLCIGMFIAHSVLSGFVNSLQREKKGITNGLYLAFYYTGGTFGTTLPSYLYKAFGWEVLCFALSGILFGSAWLFYAYRKIFKGN